MSFFFDSIKDNNFHSRKENAEYDDVILSRVFSQFCPKIYDYYFHVIASILFFYFASFLLAECELKDLRRHINSYIYVSRNTTKKIRQSKLYYGSKIVELRENDFVLFRTRVHSGTRTSLEIPNFKTEFLITRQIVSLMDQTIIFVSLRNLHANF